MHNQHYEFKCPSCYSRHSSYFEEKKNTTVKCIGCGEDFSAQLKDGRIVVASKRKASV